VLGCSRWEKINTILAGRRFWARIGISVFAGGPQVVPWGYESEGGEEPREKHVVTYRIHRIFWKRGQGGGPLGGNS